MRGAGATSGRGRLLIGAAVVAVLLSADSHGAGWRWWDPVLTYRIVVTTFTAIGPDGSPVVITSNTGVAPRECGVLKAGTTFDPRLLCAGDLGPPGGFAGDWSAQAAMALTGPLCKPTGAIPTVVDAGPSMNFNEVIRDLGSDVAAESRLATIRQQVRACTLIRPHGVSMSLLTSPSIGNGIEYRFTLADGISTTSLVEAIGSSVICVGVADYSDGDPGVDASALDRYAAEAVDRFKHPRAESGDDVEVVGSGSSS